MPTTEQNLIRRHNNKWAMFGYKGGKCADCAERVTPETSGLFDFDHIIPLKNGDDKSDRWSGSIRFWAPFTEKWFAWGKTVDLVCRACHRKRHSKSKQITFFEYSSLQTRLDDFDPGPMPRQQPELFGDQT